MKHRVLEFHALASSAVETRAPMMTHGDACRCACGSLLARVVREGLELKCRKCKSLVLIRHEELVEMYRGLKFDTVPAFPRPR